MGLAVARTAADEAELLSIAVAPEARRHGCGRALLDALIKALPGRGAAALFLEVAEPNRAARRLYGRAGFTEVGRRRNYYAGRHGTADALIMRRALPVQPF